MMVLGIECCTLPRCIDECRVTVDLMARNIRLRHMTFELTLAQGAQLSFNWGGMDEDFM
jgi:hypothetical protein